MSKIISEAKELFQGGKINMKKGQKGKENTKKDDTLMYKPIKSFKELKSKVSKSGNTKKQRKKHPKLIKALKIICVMFLLLCVIGGRNISSNCLSLHLGRLGN